jgi:hypothetical protein
MNKNMRKVACVAAVLPVLMAAKCPPRNTHPPTLTNAPGFSGETIVPQTKTCSVDDRGVNSKGVMYFHYGCTDGTTGSVVLDSTDQWNACRPGTFYPECKKH